MAASERLSIHLARPEELKDCWRMIIETNIENWDMHSCAGPLPKDLNAHKIQLLQKLQHMFDPRYNFLLVAAYGDKVAGVIWYALHDDPVYGLKHGQIYVVYIKEEFRRRGISRKLIGEVRKRVYKKGIKFLRLSALHTNTPARNLYRQLGFFDETHNMICRLELTGPEKRKEEARNKKIENESQDK